MFSSHSDCAYSTNYHDITTPEELDAVMMRSRARAVIRFYRPGCPACDASVGSWLELARRPECRMCTFVNVDVTEAPALARAMGITHVPTFVCAQRGHGAEVLVNPPAEVLRRFLETGSTK